MDINDYLEDTSKERADYSPSGGYVLDDDNKKL